MVFKSLIKYSLPPPAIFAEYRRFMEDLVIDEEDIGDDPEPLFQKAAHEGAGAAMVAKEADKETAGETKSLEAPAAPGNAPEQASQVIDGKPAAKAVLVGDSGVGKTSLLLRFSRAEFVTSKATIGVDLQAQTLSLPDGKARASCSNHPHAQEPHAIAQSCSSSPLPRLALASHRPPRLCLSCSRSSCRCGTRQEQSSSSL